MRIRFFSACVLSAVLAAQATAQTPPTALPPYAPVSPFPIADAPPRFDNGVTPPVFLPVPAEAPHSVRPAVVIEAQETAPTTPAGAGTQPPATKPPPPSTPATPTPATSTPATSTPATPAATALATPTAGPLVKTGLVAPWEAPRVKFNSDGPVGPARFWVDNEALYGGYRGIGCRRS